MHVQRVVMPVSGAESWTVLGDDEAPVGPVEAYLAYLACGGVSPPVVVAGAARPVPLEALFRRRSAWRMELVAWLELPAEYAWLGSVLLLHGGGEHRRPTGSWRRWRRFTSIRPAAGSTSASCWSPGSRPAAGAGGSRSCITSARTGRKPGGRSR